MSNSAALRRITAVCVAALALFAAFGLTPKPSLRVEAGPARSLFSKFAGGDRVTSRIRNEATVLSRIYISGSEDREKAKQLGDIVQDYGSFVVIARTKAVAARQQGLEEQVLETTVNLPGASFEPLTEAPPGSLRLGTGAAAPGKGYYILQFGASPTDEWLKSIRDAGVEILQYVPHQAFFVYAEAEAIAKVADHSRVRWIGEYRPEHKLSSVLRSQLDHARRGVSTARGISALEVKKKNTATFDIAVFSRADVDDFAAELQRTYAARSELKISRLGHNFFNLVRAEIDLSNVEAVAALPDVISISAVGPSRNEDERSIQIVAGNYLNATTILGPGYNPLSQFGADGTNVTVSVVDDGVGIPGDGGFYLSSLNVAQGPLRGAPPGAFGHGHFNASIIAGAEPFGPRDSLFYNYGIGVAPRAHILSIPRNRLGYTGTDADVYNDSVTTPGPNGSHAFISNNSWGNGTNGNHYEIGMEAVFDGFVQDASFDSGIDPITLIFSAGNEGEFGLTRPKSAKNLIAVGNSEGTRSEIAGAAANNIDELAQDTSRGPTADGRIKPDIVAPGTAITGGRSGTDSLKGNIDAFHRWSSGTSHSAAHVSGIAALFAHRWKQDNLNDLPSPSLIRGVLINSARDMNGSNSSAGIPNGAEGWGRPNLKSMLNTGVGMKYIDEAVPLQENGHGFDLDGSVADGTKPVRVTLTWTDPPGAAEPALVNDLDLTVTVDGVVYKGNVFSNGVSVTGGSADNRNNVENVFLPPGIPAGRPLKVTVTARALNGDGILGDGDQTDQRYSLVVYNYSSVVSPGIFNVAGKVVSPSGRGIGMARVMMVDNQGVVRERMTNPLGFFSFTGVPGGQTHTVNVTAKRYTFPQQTVSVTANVSSLTVVANSSNGP